MIGATLLVLAILLCVVILYVTDWGSASLAVALEMVGVGL